jgi:hypothetical protein
LGSGSDNLGNLAKIIKKTEKKRPKNGEKSWKKLEKLREKAERIAGRERGLRKTAARLRVVGRFCRVWAIQPGPRNHKVSCQNAQGKIAGNPQNSGFSGTSQHPIKSIT